MNEEPLHPALAAEDSRYRGLDPFDSEEKGGHRGGGPTPGDTAPVKRFLGLESRITDHDEGELRQIMGFAQDAGIETDGDLAVWLKSLSVKLGTPEPGMTRTRQLIGYLDMEARINEIAKQQRAFMN